MSAGRETGKACAEVPMTLTAVAPGFIEPEEPGAPRAPVPNPNAPKVEPPSRIEEPPVTVPPGSPSPVPIPDPMDV